MNVCKETELARNDTPPNMGAKEKKSGRLNTSHRYNRLPLLPSGPGGVQQELVVYDLPLQM